MARALRLLPRLSSLAWLIVGLVVALFFVSQMSEPGFYPNMRVATGGGVDLVFVNQSRSSRGACEAFLDRIEKTTTRQCPHCSATRRQCLTELPPEVARYFSDEPLPHPSAHVPSGVMVFESTNVEAAQQVCDASVAMLNQTGKDAPSRCFPANTTREFFNPQPGWADLRQVGFALFALIVAQLISRFICYLIIRYDHLHRRFTHDPNAGGPQKFHALPTPRVGGIPLMAGLFVSSVLLLSLPNRFSDQEFGLLILASLPAFLGGLTEDITKRVGVSQRLMLTILSGLFGCWLLDATLTRLGVPLLDTALLWVPFAMAFTAFAVGGVANSINIIDGYNGLAAGFGVLASAAMGLVAARHGDSLLMFSNFAMIGALLGFLGWNWPQGRIFLGDGGAYLLGFWLAEMAVLLVTRNHAVSPWFALAVMIYPVFETLFTIYRRRIMHKTHPGLPDSMHLHQMIYKRLVRIHVGTPNPTLKTRRNSKVAPYLWTLSGMFALAAVFCADNTALLQGLCLLFCLAYLALYRALLGWRVPRFLRIRETVATPEPHTTKP